MQKTLGILLLLGLATYAAACLALFLLQRSLIYFPPAEAAVQAPKVSTLAVPGGAVLKISERPRAGGKAIIYLGGNGEDVTMSLPMLDAAFPDHALYLLHYRGYTGSTGKPTEEALVADSLLLFDRVAAAHAEVALIGRSLGAGIALVASQRPVHKLVLITPFDSLAALAARQFPYFPVRWLLRDRYDCVRYAPLVRAPTLVLAAGQDDIVPAHSTARLVARFAKGVATQAVIAGAGHNSISGSAAYVHALQWAGE